MNTVEESQPEQDPSLQVEEIVGPSEERLAAVREIAKPSQMMRLKMNISMVFVCGMLVFIQRLNNS